MIPRLLAIGIILAAPVAAILAASGLFRFERPVPRPEKRIESASAVARRSG